MYADDTQFIHSCQPRDISTLKQDVEGTLKEAHGWFAANGLKLNPTKTEILLIKTRQRQVPSNFSVTFDGTTLVPSAKTRILGIIIDAHLTWEAHVSLVVRRCYATLRGLSKPGLRSRSRSRSLSRSESVVFLGVGVGVDKIYRLRPTPGKLLFLTTEIAMPII